MSRPAQYRDSAILDNPRGETRRDEDPPGPRTPTHIEFRLLGPLEIHVDGHEVTPSAPKLRQVLALLLLRRESLVQTSELIDELWHGAPPPSAIPTLQTYVYKLRKILGSVGANVDIRTRTSGYVVHAPDAVVDVSRFEICVDRGIREFTSGELECSVSRLGEGLSVWRGPALADVERGEILAPLVARLEEERMRALEMRIEGEIRLGRCEALVGELRSLTVDHPLHEGLHAKLMLALSGAGRRYEALDVYRSLRDTLVRELGVEPSTEIRAIHQGLLMSGPDEAEPAPAAPRRGYGSPVRTPAQIPPDAPHFQGYGGELRTVEGCFPGKGADTAIRVVSITGMPGVGKTALAVHAAHRLRGRFEDGQLFARLGGDRADPVDPGSVLRGFLVSLGVAAEQIPDGLEERAKLFRTCTSGQRVLIVLDNAASADQVEHLVPGGPQCGVIVTSRPHILHDSCVVSLHGLDRSDAIELFKGIVGERRVAREAREAEQIVRSCGGLPLAIKVVGARLAAVPGLPLASISRELCNADRRLDALRFQGLDLRARYHSSYMHLHVQEAGLLRLLSILPENVFTAERAARLLNCSVEEVEPLLSSLVENRFLQVWEKAGGSEVLYYFHELIRLYARERMKRENGGRAAGTPR
ncbi:DNA-binding transcriptional activator of the SARP family [Nocardiopsis flavescens]|uniref:DNA-binding transcriptional activator of the SARP family n=1 Tax=Nocardiopsis flavescens TaxID=758803 RepID=A0A1M6BKL7_9ACTN|nr:AfsR/SARP family transcriptional regulator [Nocardiopsis flavescens]SHI49330.1 DNA-binding transcriptional activator of the SARP family [Nocardiopsis flavescens]